MAPGLRFDFISILLLCLSELATSSLTNRTIDDSYGDTFTGVKPYYLPTTVGVWKNASCTDCAVNPDPEKAFHGTWTAATFLPELGSMSVNFNFTGIAIYVYFILANNVAFGITTLTQCNFTIDNELIGSFQHIPISTSELQYNALVYSNKNLTNNTHTFSIITANQDHDVLVTFDYAVYTFDDGIAPDRTDIPNGSSVSRKPAPTTAIAGGVVGGVVLLLSLLLVIFLFLRRRRQCSEKASVDKLMVEPFTGVMSTPRFTQARDQPILNTITSGKSAAMSNPGRQSSVATLSPIPPRHASTMTRPATSSSTSEPISQALASSVALGHTPSSTPPTQPMTTTRTVQIEERRIRQAELERQMQEIHREIQHLDPDDIDAPSRQEGSSQDNHEIGELKEQVRMMKLQIERLQQEQQSPWAQGLTDEPPPTYAAYAHIA